MIFLYRDDRWPALPDHASPYVEETYRLLATARGSLSTP
jgi:hypothetical protein